MLTETQTQEVSLEAGACSDAAVSLPAGIGKCGHLAAAFEAVQARAVPVALRYSDMDPYGHMTSGAYIEVLGAALAADAQGRGKALAKGRSITSADIAFKRPVPLSVTVVHAHLENAPGELRFRITDEGASQEYAAGNLVLSHDSLDVLPLAAFGAPANSLIYQTTERLRFSDFNTHNQLDLSRYLGLVIASRFGFFEAHFGFPVHELTRQGLGFFNTSAHLRFHTPVTGVSAIRVTSWVAELRRGDTEMAIPFLVQDARGERVFASGQLVCGVIDLTGAPKRTPLPTWGDRFIFKETR